MRTKILALIFALAVIAGIPTFGILASTYHPLYSPLQGATCADADFLAAVGKDFTDLGKDLGTLKPDDAAGLVQAELAIAVIRQKYEDMTVKPECLGAQVSIVVFSANIGDIISLYLGKLADPKNAADYDKALKNQSDRLSKLGDQFKTMIGAPTK